MNHQFNTISFFLKYSFLKYGEKNIVTDLENYGKFQQINYYI